MLYSIGGWCRLDGKHQCDPEMEPKLFWDSEELNIELITIKRDDIFPCFGSMNGKNIWRSFVKTRYTSIADPRGQVPTSGTVVAKN